MMKMTVSKCLAALVSLFLWSGIAQASEFVVLSSTVATITAGQIIAPGQNVELPKKGRLVLINEAGQTVSLKGPYSGTPGDGKGEGKSRLVAALSSLVSSTQQDTRSVGAIRAAGIRTKRDAMMINLSETGDYCLPPKAGREITRYKSEAWPEVTITAIADGTAETMAWSKGTRDMAWPDALTIADGARFLVTQGGKDTKTLLTIHELAGDFETDVHLVLGMAEKGCMEQAKMMLALIRKSAT